MIHIEQLLLQLYAPLKLDFSLQICNIIFFQISLNKFRRYWQIHRRPEFKAVIVLPTITRNYGNYVGNAPVGNLKHKTTENALLTALSI